MTYSTTLPYIVYVLRFWSENDDRGGWRFSLEDPRTGARRGFAGLEELTSFLLQETAEQTKQSGISVQGGSSSDGG